MKSIFKFGAVAALTLFAASCAKEQIASENETVATSFAVELPGGVTKATGDGMTATQLYYQVFDKDGNAIEGLGVQTKTLQAGKASVSFNLVKGQEYNFVFWAQTPVAGYYTIDEADGLKKISANYADKAANDENFDAFYAVEKLTVNAGTAKEVSLTRPFAQVNIATVGKLTAGSASRDVNFDGAVSSVSFKNIPTVFAPLADDDVVDGTETITFASAAVPEGNITVAGNDYKYLSLNYIFAPKGGSVYDINAEFVVEGKTVPLEVNAAPVKRNYRTNIVGNLLLASGQFDVVVDPGFEGGEVVDLDEIAFREALKNGGKGVVAKDMTLTKYISLKQNTNPEIVIEKGATLTGELTNSAKLISLFYSNINCTLSGDGCIIAPTHETNSPSAAIELEDNTNSLVIDGNLTVEGRNGTVQNRVDACMIIRAGKVTVNGGHFIASKDVDGGDNPAILLYSPNSYRSELVINGGIFESVCGNCKFLINKQDEYRDHATVSIYGGTFVGWNPADNEAEGAHTNFVADGYRSVETTYEGKQAWTVEAIPAVGTQEELDDAITAAVVGETAVIPLSAGEFTTYKKEIAKGKTLTFIGAGVDNTTYTCGYDTSIIGSEYGADYSLENSDVTFKNMKVATEMSANYRGFIRPKSLTFENCVIEGRFSYLGVGKVQFTNCVFNTTAEDYNLWLYSGNDFVFDNCTFNCKGKCINAYKEQQIPYKVTVKNCTFNSTKVNKSAIELKANATKKYELYFVGTNKCTNFATSTVTGSALYNSNSETDSIVYVDGVKVWENGAKVTE